MEEDSVLDWTIKSFPWGIAAREKFLSSKRIANLEVVEVAAVVATFTILISQTNEPTQQFPNLCQIQAG